MAESNIERAARAAPFASTCLCRVLSQARGEVPSEPVPFYCEIVEFKTEPDGGIAFSVTVDLAKVPDEADTIIDFEPSP